MKKEIRASVELTVLHIDFKIRFYRTADFVQVSFSNKTSSYSEHCQLKRNVLTVQQMLNHSGHLITSLSHSNVHKLAVVIFPVVMSDIIYQHQDTTVRKF